MGLLFMWPIIVQPNANVYSYTPRKHLCIHHLVVFPMTVDNMTVANVSHSTNMTNSFMHHSTINFDPLHAPRHAV